MIDTTPERTAPPSAPPRVHWGAVGLFVLLSYGLAWLFALPLWLGRGLQEPSLPAIAVLVMTTPTIAALAVVLLVMRTRSPARFLGLTVTRPGRTVLFGLAGAAGGFLLTLAALLVAGASGVVRIAAGPATAQALLAVPVLAVLIGFAAVGEEIGWRGFLLPALRPIGTWPALVISGVVWGLWHAPLILLGYNFGTKDPAALLVMAGGTVFIGILVGWLRMRTGSVWAGALTHGAINASAGSVLVAFVAGDADPAATLLGWCGWLVCAATAAVLVAARTFRWSEPLRDLARAPEPAMARR